MTETPKYTTSSDEITSAKDVFDIAERVNPNAIVLFRGQNVDEPLLPKFARLAKELDLPNPEETEFDIFNSFKSMSVPYLQREVEPEWDWLALARHHGLPTRLLDWSANVFVALWFAVRGRTNNDNQKSILYVLEAKRGDLRLPKDNESIFSLSRTYIFQPRHISRNISAQAGWFTVHKYIREKNRFISLEKNKNFGHKLTKWYVNDDSIPTIKEELFHLGLNNFTLFPDLDHLCQHLEEEITKKHNRGSSY